MQKYVDAILTYTSKLNSIGFKMTTECTGAILLAGLTKKYQPFIMGIEASETDITADKIVSKLSFSLVLFIIILHYILLY